MHKGRVADGSPVTLYNEINKGTIDSMTSRSGLADLQVKQVKHCTVAVICRQGLHTRPLRLVPQQCLSLAMLDATKIRT